MSREFSLSPADCEELARRKAEARARLRDELVAASTPIDFHDLERMSS
jgi:hypothetical protein